MSFETVFKQWLQNKGVEEGEGAGRKRKDDVVVVEDDEGGGRAADDVAGEEDEGVEEEMPVIQREAWREEEMEGMPVLQKMVDLPPAQDGRKLRSPPPPPLQITLSLTPKNGQSKGVKRKDKGKSPIQSLIDKKDDTNQTQIEEIPFCKNLSHSSHAHVQGHQPCHFHKGSGQTDSQEQVKGKPVRHCHEKSALTELNHISPTLPRGLEVDSVVSPHCDSPMEPDSTSEFVAGSGRWLQARKGSERSRGEASPWGEVSPCSTGCAGLRTPVGNGCEVLVRVEESAAECDSTSMFINSPSAISPASQGEIEERVCPLSAEREDGASPAHCVCRCRSLSRPSVSVARDHPSNPTGAPCKLTVKHTGPSKCESQPKSLTPLVSGKHRVDDDPAPHLEKVAPSLDLMTTPSGSNSEHDSPPVLTLSEQEAQHKPFSLHHSQTDLKQHEAPPLIMFETSSSQTNGEQASDCAKYNNTPPKLSSSLQHSQEKDACGPPVLSLHGKQASSKSSGSKSQSELCDLTSNIDWQTAVAETVESPPNLTKYDAERKPGIVIKIRTKGTTPQVQLLSEPKPAPLKLKRKVDPDKSDNEIISRLRKRVKSESCEQNAASVSAEEEQHIAPPETNKPADKNKKNHSIHCHWTDLKISSTQHLSLQNVEFAQSSVELYRLQVLTRDLLCVIFPSLQPQLKDMAPDSRSFDKIIDDIILSIERPACESTLVDCEEVREQFDRLTVNNGASVPVYSPQVILCNNPKHGVEDFKLKLCSLCQLLLPDLCVSLTNTLTMSSQHLEMFLKKIIMINKAKAAKKHLLHYF